ncbi:hypothetical protein KAR91_86430 [Candidatus Pacearchaeota archaeon]|nr:hypothetical protein [Candidatus Pacearchaeota archaeon]
MKEFRILAASPKERPYTPLECEGMDTPPVFTVSSATRREFLTIMSENEINVPKEALKKAAAANSEAEVGEILANMGGDNIWKTVLDSHILNIEILKKKLKGWSKLPDTEGDNLPFSEENIEYLSDELIADLVREITGQARPEEEKKSEKESSSSSGSETAIAETSGTAPTAEAESSIEPGTVKAQEDQQE